VTAPEIITQMRARRLDLKLSQLTVADRAGYSATMVSLWETGSRAPGLRALIDWAEALGFEIKVAPKVGAV
jgi:transcriptional regulator with XRE-family HTH domain